jgi:DNA-binding LytR/AlgR family response regulator
MYQLQLNFLVQVHKSFVANLQQVKSKYTIQVQMVFICVTYF